MIKENFGLPTSSLIKTSTERGFHSLFVKMSRARYKCSRATMAEESDEKKPKSRNFSLGKDFNREKCHNLMKLVVFTELHTELLIKI